MLTLSSSLVRTKSHIAWKVSGVSSSNPITNKPTTPVPVSRMVRMASSAPGSQAFRFSAKFSTIVRIYTFEADEVFVQMGVRPISSSSGYLAMLISDWQVQPCRLSLLNASKSSAQ